MRSRQESYNTYIKISILTKKVIHIVKTTIPASEIALLKKILQTRLSFWNSDLQHINEVV